MTTSVVDIDTVDTCPVCRYILKHYTSNRLQLLPLHHPDIPPTTTSVDFNTRNSISSMNLAWRSKNTRDVKKLMEEEGITKSLLANHKCTVATPKEITEWITWRAPVIWEHVKNVMSKSYRITHLTEWKERWVVQYTSERLRVLAMRQSSRPMVTEEVVRLFKTEQELAKKGTS